MKDEMVGIATGGKYPTDATTNCKKEVSDFAANGNRIGMESGEVFGIGGTKVVLSTSIPQSPSLASSQVVQEGLWGIEDCICIQHIVQILFHSISR